MLSVVTWNVNSLRSRLTHVLEFLRNERPDIVLLQELKLEESVFPYEEIETAGYNHAVFGQKTYNGVAILSRFPLQDVRKGLSCDEENGQARYIEALAETDGKVIRVASVYVPNGQSVDSEKFTYKLNFFDCLRHRLQQLVLLEETTVIGGDFNVAPQPIDVYDPRQLEGTVCFHPQERDAWRRITALGYTDAWRALQPESKSFSWWDYRMNGFERNHGLRIDHLLLSPEAADRLRSADILKDERAKDKPSDHAPVLCRLEI